MKRSGLSIAALVLGIVSCSLFCVTYISVPCGILAIIFGAIEIKKSQDKMAKAGLIMGIIGVSVMVIIIVVGFLLGLVGIMGFTSFILGLGV